MPAVRLGGQQLGGGRAFLAIGNGKEDGEAAPDDLVGRVPEQPLARRHSSS